MFTLKIKVTLPASMGLFQKKRNCPSGRASYSQAIGKTDKRRRGMLSYGEGGSREGLLGPGEKQEFRVIVSHGLSGWGSGLLVGDTMYIFPCWSLEQTIGSCQGIFCEASVIPIEWYGLSVPASPSSNPSQLQRGFHLLIFTNSSMIMVKNSAYASYKVKNLLFCVSFQTSSGIVQNTCICVSIENACV